jgi:tRNA(Ile)-lysidine synthase
VRPGALSPAAASLDDAFAVAMARFGPFEPAPFLAAAVSGGPDSTALALLASAWAESRGGKVVALTVDHRLRPESEAETAEVAATMRARGIEHVTLVRERALAGNLQQAARAERYRLLGEWCRERGCLHLLLGHQAEDQAETLLLRLARGSGVDGLAAMSAELELDDLRVLRPLLGIGRARLLAYLGEQEVSFVEDPSNATKRFARNRVRAALQRPLSPPGRETERGSAPERALAAEGLSVARLLVTARNLGRARAALELGVDALLAECAALDPAGFALVDEARLGKAPAELRLRALARLVTTIGGRAHPPRLERLERAAAALGEARTLAGCGLLPWRGRLLVCREAAACAPPLALAPGVRARWDGRYALELRPDAPPGLRVGTAGRGWPGALPGAVKETLPALFDLEGAVEVPHLGYRRAGSETLLKTFVWRPEIGLTRAGFTVA